MTTDVRIGQPAAYWTGAAYEALIAFTRARMAENGITQPQFWILRHLSADDLSPDGRGRTIPELERAMSGYLRAEDDLAAAAEPMLDKGWVTRDGRGRLWLTEAGDRVRVDQRARAPEIVARIHEGVDDADYAITLRVLQRMIANVTG